MRASDKVAASGMRRKGCADVATHPRVELGRGGSLATPDEASACCQSKTHASDTNATNDGAAPFIGTLQRLMRDAGPEHRLPSAPGSFDSTCWYRSAARCLFFLSFRTRCELATYSRGASLSLLIAWRGTSFVTACEQKQGKEHPRAGRGAMSQVEQRTR